MSAIPGNVTLTSADLPVPMPVPAPTPRTGCTTLYSTAPVDLPYSSGLFASSVAEYFNQLLAELATIAAYGGGIPSILSGLGLYAAYNAGVAYLVGQSCSYSGASYTCILASSGNLPTNATYFAPNSLPAVIGLQIGAPPGFAINGGLVEFAGGIVVSPYATLAINYVWLQQSPWNNITKSAGTLAVTNTKTPPAGAPSVLLGTFPTASSVIGAIDSAGVCYLSGGMSTRFTADRSCPVDSPSPNSSFLTKTSSGTFHWNGSDYNSLTPTSLGALNIKQALTGDFTTIPQDNFHNISLDPSGSNRVVFLPDPATVGNAWRAAYTHIGTANTLVVKDYTGVTTYGTLTTTNRSLSVSTYTNSSGNIVFPAAPYSPGPIPTPGPAFPV